MDTGTLVSWAFYGVASLAFAFFANRHFRREHEKRMAVIDAAIEADQARFRALQAKWAAEDEEYERAEKARAAAEEEVDPAGVVA